MNINIDLIISIIRQDTVSQNQSSVTRVSLDAHLRGHDPAGGQPLSHITVTFIYSSVRRSIELHVTSIYRSERTATGRHLTFIYRSVRRSIGLHMTFIYSSVRTTTEPYITFIYSSVWRTIELPMTFIYSSVRTTIEPNIKKFTVQYGEPLNYI